MYFTLYFFNYYFSISFIIIAISIIGIIIPTVNTISMYWNRIFISEIIILSHYILLIFLWIAELYGDHHRQSTVFFYLWVASAVFSSCYTYIWDIKMDWGLVDRNAGENKGLREEVVYAYKVSFLAELHML